MSALWRHDCGQERAELFDDGEGNLSLGCFGDYEGASVDLGEREALELGLALLTWAVKR